MDSAPPLPHAARLIFCGILMHERVVGDDVVSAHTGEYALVVTKQDGAWLHGDVVVRSISEVLVDGRGARRFRDLGVNAEVPGSVVDVDEQSSEAKDACAWSIPPIDGCDVAGVFGDVVRALRCGLLAAARQIARVRIGVVNIGRLEDSRGTVCDLVQLAHDWWLEAAEAFIPEFELGLLLVSEFASRDVSRPMLPARDDGRVRGWNMTNLDCIVVVKWNRGRAVAEVDGLVREVNSVPACFQGADTEKIDTECWCVRALGDLDLGSRIPKLVVDDHVARAVALGNFNLVICDRERRGRRGCVEELEH